MGHLAAPECTVQTLLGSLNEPKLGAGKREFATC